MHYHADLTTLGAMQDLDEDESTCLEDAEKRVTDLISKNLSIYHGTGVFNTNDEALAAAKIATTETALENFATTLAADVKNHDYGPINLGSTVAFMIDKSGEEYIYTSKDYTYAIVNKPRWFNKNNCEIPVDNIKTALEGGAFETTGLYQFTTQRILGADYENVEYDMQNVQLYDKETRTLYTGPEFVKVDELTNGFTVSYSFNSDNYKNYLGQWYLLIPVTAKHIFDDTQEFYIKIKLSFTE